MRKDKKIREKITAILNESLPPFEEWAREHGLNVKTTSDVAATPSDEPKKPSLTLKKRIIASVSALVIVLAIVIPVSILLTKPPAEQTPRMFGAIDVDVLPIEKSEFLNVPDFYSFDLSKIAQTEAAELFYKDVTKDDAKLPLSYFLKDALVAAEHDGAYYGFKLTYRVQVYEHYVFVDYENYSEPTDRITAGELDIGYKIISNAEQPAAYASFKKGNYAYYLEARGFEGVTQMNQNTFEILIGYLFS